MNLAMGDDESNMMGVKGRQALIAGGVIVSASRPRRLPVQRVAMEAGSSFAEQVAEQRR